MYGSIDGNANPPNQRDAGNCSDDEETDFILTDDKKSSHVGVYTSMVSFGLLILAFMAFITTQNLKDNGTSPVFASFKTISWPENGMVLSSNDVSVDEYMDGNYTCAKWGYVTGFGNNPGFYWSNYPAKTKSFVLLMLTLFPSGDYKSSWILYNIPSSTTTVTAWCDADDSCPGTTGGNFPSGIIGYSSPCAHSKSNFHHLSPFTFQLNLLHIRR